MSVRRSSHKRSIPLVVYALATLGACSSPDPAYYTLQPVAGRTTTIRARLIKVAHPGLAGYLDRSDIVLKQTDYRVDVDSQVRWGEPLADMIGRVLAQDLSQRLPGSSIFSGDGAIGADPDLRVEVDVRRFDAAADGSVTLLADMAIEPGVSHKAVAANSISIRLANIQTGPSGLASALSDLLGQFADQIAANIARQ